MVWRRFYLMLGINPEQLETILAIKLKMDGRRPIFNISAKQQQGKTSKNINWGMMIFMFFIGLIVSISFFMNQLYLVQIIYFAIFMFFLVMMLITDFTHVLLDERDNTIILARPVNDATFTASRILHIAIYTFKMVLAFSLPGIVVMFIAQGWPSGLMLIPQLLIASILSLLLVNIVYLGLLKMANPQQFKQIISYFQIFFVATLFLLIQVLPRLMMGNKNIDVVYNQWLMVFPNVWIASLREWAFSFTTASIHLHSMAFLAIVSPFVALFIILKLSKGFNQKLSSLSGSGTLSTKVNNKQNRQTFLSKISNLLTGDGTENAGFRFTWFLSGRLRDYKIKVYPSFAHVPVVYLFYFINTNGSISEILTSITDDPMFVLLSYMTSFVFISIFTHVIYTEKYKASWVYYVTPFAEPGKFFTGMYKALFVKYFVTIFLAISVFVMAICGISMANDLLLIFIFNLLFGLFLASMEVKKIPFSQPVSVDSKPRFLKVFMTIFLPLLMAFIHYWLIRWEMVINIFVLMLIPVTYIAFNSFQKTQWKELAKAGE